MKKIISLIFYVLLVVQGLKSQQSKSDRYVHELMKGISNDNKNWDKPFVAAGDRTYIIGTMDGMFPDMGFHIKGEMAGLWLHPIKLMDGYWSKLTDITGNKDEWLIKANDFVNYPYGNKQVYNKVLNDFSVERFQFCPDGEAGMIVRYTIKNKSNKKRKIKFTFAGKSDISPVWSSDLLNIYDSKDTIVWDNKSKEITGQDITNPWFLNVSSNMKNAIGITENVEIPQQTLGRGKAFAIESEIELAANGSKTIGYIISGSDKSKDKASAENKNIKANTGILLNKKIQLYTGIINKAKLTIPDKKLQQLYNWVKFNTQWLIRDVPGIGRGLSAGLMDYPWWFGCDNGYGVQAAVTGGEQAISISTLRLLKEVSQKNCEDNGQIVHEIEANGVVYNTGNTQETPHFIETVWKVYEWTGDNKFLADMYPYVKKGINWLLNDMDTNKNLYPEGYGIAEVPGLDKEMMDVAAYTQSGLECAAKMAGVFKETDMEEAYSRKAAILKEKINKDFWNEQAVGYHQFYATKQEAISVVESTIADTKDKAGFNPYKSQNAREEKLLFFENLKKEFNEMPEGRRVWSLSKNSRSLYPMLLGIAPKEKAIRSMDLIRQSYKMGMSISAGTHAVSECRYGRINEALAYTQSIVDAFSHTLPGSVYEIMPDKGCFTQEWTNYGVIIPIIQYVFGIQPKAYEKNIDITPNLPEGWNDMSIEALRIGDTELTMKRYEKGDDVYYDFFSLKPGWKLQLKLPHNRNAIYTINNVKTSPTQSEEKDCFTLTAISNSIKISKIK